MDSYYLRLGISSRWRIRVSNIKMEGAELIIQYILQCSGEKVGLNLFNLFRNIYEFLILLGCFKILYFIEYFLNITVLILTIRWQDVISVIVKTTLKPVQLYSVFCD